MQQEVKISESVQLIIPPKEEIDDQEAPTVEEKKDENVQSGDDMPKRISIAAKNIIDVPFIVQAPFADWNEVYKEACEEAAVLMVYSYYEDIEELSQEEMKSAIDGIIYWGDDTFGSFDTSAEDTARYFSEKLGYNNDKISVIYDMTIDDMKALLDAGIPIIVPAAGRELGNIYFQTPGPLYHMLVLVGYDNDEFITNDPGTRRGEGYRYDQEVLYNAIHDLTPNIEKITDGRKAMIVVQPQ